MHNTEFSFWIARSLYKHNESKWVHLCVIIVFYGEGVMSVPLYCIHSSSRQEVGKRLLDIS